jgi:hypothetical protein
MKIFFVNSVYLRDLCAPLKSAATNPPRAYSPFTYLHTYMFTSFTYLPSLYALRHPLPRR